MNFVSQSMLNAFYRCPEQFRQIYIEGIKIPPGIAARRGSATHKAAEINHFQKKTTKEDLPLDTLQDAARDEYVRLIKEKGVFIPKEHLSEKNNLLGKGLDASIRLTKLYREELAPEIQPLIVEERITIDVGLDIPLAGTLDVVTVDNVLEDFKTADKSKNESEVKNSLQLIFYSGLYYYHTGEWPKKSNLRFLVDNKTPKLQTYSVVNGPAEWQNLLFRIKLMLKQIQAGLFPPCAPDSWICSPTWCGFYQICRYPRR